MRSKFDDSKKKQIILFADEIVKYFNEKGYSVEERGPLDLIVKKGSSIIPVEVKCRTRRIKNDDIFTVQFTMNELAQLTKKRGRLLLVDKECGFYEFKVV